MDEPRVGMTGIGFRVVEQVVDFLAVEQAAQQAQTFAERAGLRARTA